MNAGRERRAAAAADRHPCRHVRRRARRRERLALLSQGGIASTRPADAWSSRPRPTPSQPTDLATAQSRRITARNAVATGDYELRWITNCSSGRPERIPGLARELLRRRLHRAGADRARRSTGRELARRRRTFKSVNEVITHGSLRIVRLGRVSRRPYLERHGVWVALLFSTSSGRRGRRLPALRTTTSSRGRGSRWPSTTSGSRSASFTCPS